MYEHMQPTPCQQQQGPVMAVLPAIAAGVSIIGGVKSLFAKTPKQEATAAQVVEPSTPTVMPTTDSELTAEAKRRTLMAAQARGGRTSTILSESDTFGGN